jgi:hypothetical protein
MWKIVIRTLIINVQIYFFESPKFETSLFVGSENMIPGACKAQVDRQHSGRSWGPQEQPVKPS